MQKISTAPTIAAAPLFSDKKTLVSDFTGEFPVGIFLSQINRNSNKAASFGVDIPASKLPNVQSDITIDLLGNTQITVYDESQEGVSVVWARKDRPSTGKTSLYDRLQTFIADIRNGRLESALKGFQRVS